jgi:hypothetical protein
MNLNVAAVHWSNIDDIDDIEPVNEADSECLSEVRDVLRRHGKLDRFGIALLHSHFAISDDEILLEVTDADARTLTTKPVRKADAGSSNVGTIWQLQEAGEPITNAYCKSYCYVNKPFGNHTKQHRRVKD